MEWSYGVTTCPQRLDTLLPRTLASLAAAGFDAPRLFVDGPYTGPLPATQRDKPLGAFGNWILAAWELYIRKPQARRYAIFQDDLVMCCGVKEYLEKQTYPIKGYLNLFTFASNESIIFGKPTGWHKSDQLGKGAVALVFDHWALYTMLHQVHMVNKPQLYNGNQSIDGAVQQALVAGSGFTEYVHNPSLVQHMGKHTSIGEDNNGKKHPQELPAAKTFVRESFNAMEFLR